MELEHALQALPPEAHPALASLLQYWMNTRPPDGAPSRSHFEPFRLRKWLGHVSIYESVKEGEDFRNRLEGTSIVAITGEDWTGRFASQVDARFGSRLVRCMRRVIESGEPSIHTMKLFQNGFKDVTRLLLPVSSGTDGKADQVFLVIYFDPDPNAEKQLP